MKAISHPALISLLALPAINALALTPPKRSLEVIVHFSVDSALPAAVEQSKLTQAIGRVRSEKWCSLEIVVVIGYARIDETASGRLSEDRAAAVAAHLQRLGASPRIIYVEGQGAKYHSGERAGARAAVEMVGDPPYEDCGSAKARDGLTQ